MVRPTVTHFVGNWGLLTVVLSVLPTLVVLTAIARFAVDVPYWDEWEFVDIFMKAHSGALSIADLWSQHGEHRLLVPNILMYWVASITNWDVRVNMYLSVGFAAVELVALYGLMRATRTPRTARARSIAFVLTSALVFSLAQWENWTWGFEVQWYLNIAAATLSILALAYMAESWRGLVVSAVFATVATYSLGNGMLVLLLNFVYILASWKRGRLRWLAIWSFFSASVIYSYIWNYQSQEHISVSPLLYLTYFLAYSGGWVGDSVRSISGYLSTKQLAPMPAFVPQYVPILAVGAAVVAGLASLVSCAAFAFLQEVRLRTQGPGDKDARRDGSCYRAWLMLAAYAVLSGAGTAYGRASLGLEQALSSRYDAMSNLLWISLLALGADVVLSLHRSSKTLANLLNVTALVLGVLFVGATVGGIVDLRQRRDALTNGLVSLQDPNATDVQLAALYPVPSILRARAAWLRTQRIGPFSDASIASVASEQAAKGREAEDWLARVESPAYSRIAVPPPAMTMTYGDSSSLQLTREGAQFNVLDDKGVNFYVGLMNIYVGSVGAHWGTGGDCGGRAENPAAFVLVESATGDWVNVYWNTGSGLSEAERSSVTGPVVRLGKYRGFPAAAPSDVIGFRADVHYQSLPPVHDEVLLAIYSRSCN